MVCAWTLEALTSETLPRSKQAPKARTIRLRPERAMAAAPTTNMTIASANRLRLFRGAPGGVVIVTPVSCSFCARSYSVQSLY